MNIIKKFPNALFILTKRDKNDWLNALSKKPNLNDDVNRNSWKDKMRKHLYGKAKFDRILYSEAYDEYHSKIERIFKHNKKQLLTVSVFKDNVWEELASFLNCVVKHEVFPWENKGYQK